MKRFIKIVSTVTLLCFAVTNISFAIEPNSFKLAAPSSFSGMKGLEFKEAAQVQLGIREALRGLQEFNIDSIKSTHVHALEYLLWYSDFYYFIIEESSCYGGISDLIDHVS